MTSKVFIISTTLLVLLSCKKQEYQVTNLNNNRISILGHAGMGLGDLYPMNSFESLHKCLNLGTDGVEFDVQMSRDSVLVLFHDMDLSTSTNLNGRIHEHTWSELRQARYSLTPYLDYSLTSMDEFFQSIEDLHAYVFTMDCKLYPAHSETNFRSTYSNALHAIIKKFQLEDQVCIESQDVEFLKGLKLLNPDLNLFIYPADFEAGLLTAMTENLYGITISSENITKEQVATAHQQGLRIAVWNTHSARDNEEAVRKNPDYIQTDKVTHLLKLLK